MPIESFLCDRARQLERIFIPSPRLNEQLVGQFEIVNVKDQLAPFVLM